MKRIHKDISEFAIVLSECWTLISAEICINIYAKEATPCITNDRSHYLEQIQMPFK